MNAALKAIDSRTSLARDRESVAEDGEVQSDMYSKWTSAKTPDHPKMSKMEMIVNFSTVIFAGSNTTTTRFRAIIYYLCKDPSKMKKVVDELDMLSVKAP